MNRKLAIAGAIAVMLLPVAGCGSHPHVTANTPPMQTSEAPSAPAASNGAAAKHQQRATKHAKYRAGALRAAATRVPAGVPMPSRALTPGAIQSSDTAAICTPGWAEAHRNVSYATEDYVAREYGLSSHYGYEIDHLIPLELGGSNSIRNLWPEPYNSTYGAYQKDGLEDYLRQQVCDHGLPLASAQHETAVNWYTAWIAAGRPVPQDFGYGTGPAPVASPSSQPPAAAWCSATASYSSSYGDYDVYVHSNQPDRSVTASGGGSSHSWHTDSSGYADVYLRGPQPGQQITVTVGDATCSTTVG
jgi:hypothetical protein